MPPQQTPIPQITPDIPQPQTPPTMPQAPAPKSKKGLYIAIVILLAVLVGVGSYFVFFKKDSGNATTETPQQSVEAPRQEEQELAPIGCKDGEAEFASDNIGLHFCYPAAWGNASMETGGEQQAGHLVAGNEYKIVFSKNDSVYAGFKSVEWTHNEIGHDGGEANGTNDFNELRQAKEYLRSSYIYTDTESQFAYITDCVEFCYRGNPRVQLTYGVKIPDNQKYELIVFYQDGPEFGSEFGEPSEKSPGSIIVSYDKVQAADLTKILPKTDILYTVLQRVAETVRK